MYNSIYRLYIKFCSNIIHELYMKFILTIFGYHMKEMLFVL